MNSTTHSESVMLDGDEHSSPSSLGVSLLFPPGKRPSTETIGRLFDANAMSGIGGRVSYRPADGKGWLEILVSGLIFELRGLAPASPALARSLQHIYGFAGGVPDEPLEAVEILPSRHIASGSALRPVVRTIAHLAANLVLHLPVAAVAWHGAETCMEPRYFSHAVLNWLAGGAFPTLGLTALVPGSDGSVGSSGLAAFTGQEMRLAGAPDEDPVDTMKLAARVADWLVRNGPLASAREIASPSGPLVAEPSRYGNSVWVWRKG